MKTFTRNFSAALALLCLTCGLAIAGGTNNSASSKQSQQQIQNDIANANARIRELNQERTKAVQVAKSRLPAAQQGISLLKKYDTLVKARYVDDDGEFEPGQELARGDRDNINKLFKVYLHWVPLKGRVSAGKGRKTLTAGIDTLKDWASDLDSPSEDNNSDVQILSQRIDDEQHSVERLVDLADNLGYKVNDKAIASGIPTADVPATTPDLAPAVARVPANESSPAAGRR